MTSINTEQTAALLAVKKGKNIFLTGAGGTGKSHTIRAITSWATAAGVRCAVTAMTGCAALLLSSDGAPNKAKTLHSWAGVGLAREAPHELAEIVARNRRAARRWINTQLLIVDEISMMTPDFLEKLDLTARRVRKNQTKFGGLQLVFAGDFCQLPPVSKGITQFVFESPIWSELIDETHNLVQIVRQSDPAFQKLLTEARMGSLSPESLSILESRRGLNWQNGDIIPTLLFARNAEVDRINKMNMESLDGERHIYEVKTVTSDLGPSQTIVDPEIQRALTKLDNDAPYDTALELCMGAQVMLLVNMNQEHGLVNGSRGVVTGFSPGGLPLVRFLNSAGSIIVDRANWWLPEPDTVGRSQIPLKVAYAITIHKSQGATLDSALVDIGSSTFECGQAYVALSRCRSLEGLYVWKLDSSKIKCHPTVARFYEGLKSQAETTPEAKSPESDTWLANSLSPAWLTVVDPLITGIITKVATITPTGSIAPPPEDVFAAFRACPDPAAVRVIILGQDPYPTEGNAHGLSFSVRPNAKLPASLKNIYKELVSDLGTPPPTTGCLQAWADQGVFLLNDVLTVAVGKPTSHSGLGWEMLTAHAIAAILQKAPHVVLIAWGRPAQKKLEHPAVKPYLASHTVLTAPHPSPLSAHTGFYGSKPFSRANAALVAHGQTPIQWTL